MLSLTQTPKPQRLSCQKPSLVRGPHSERPLPGAAELSAASLGDMLAPAELAMQSGRVSLWGFYSLFPPGVWDSVLFSSLGTLLPLGSPSLTPFLSPVSCRSRLQCCGQESACCQLQFDARSLIPFSYPFCHHQLPTCLL